MQLKRLNGREWFWAHFFVLFCVLLQVDSYHSFVISGEKFDLIHQNWIELVLKSINGTFRMFCKFLNCLIMILFEFNRVKNSSNLLAIGYWTEMLDWLYKIWFGIVWVNIPNDTKLPNESKPILYVLQILYRY